MAAEVRDRQTALEALSSTDPDVLVLDGSIVSPGIPADVLAQEASKNNVPVVLVLSSSDEVDSLHLVSSGYHGLVNADATQVELIAAAVMVASGGLYVSSVFARVVVDALDQAALTSTRQSTATTVGLTKREADVWHVLVQGRSNAQIAEELGIAPSTARFHVSNILRKTGLRSRMGLMARLVDADLGRMSRHT